jgi:hypothetical protein
MVSHRSRRDGILYASGWKRLFSDILRLMPRVACFFRRRREHATLRQERVPDGAPMGKKESKPRGLSAAGGVSTYGICASSSPGRSGACPRHVFAGWHASGHLAKSMLS